MGEEKQFHRRSGILLGLFVLCLAPFAVILYDARVVNAEDYLSQSSTRVTTTQKVEDYRGIITDRNGKTLLSLPALVVVLPLYRVIHKKCASEY